MGEYTWIDEIKETIVLIGILCLMVIGYVHRKNTTVFAAQEGYLVRKCSFRRFKHHYAVGRLNGVFPVQHDAFTIIDRFNTPESRTELSIELTQIQGILYLFNVFSYWRYLWFLITKIQKFNKGE
jgi:hypothetical protein